MRLKRRAAMGVMEALMLALLGLSRGAKVERDWAAWPPWSWCFGTPSYVLGVEGMIRFNPDSDLSLAWFSRTPPDKVPSKACDLKKSFWLRWPSLLILSSVGRALARSVAPDGSQPPRRAWSNYWFSMLTWWGSFITFIETRPRSVAWTFGVTMVPGCSSCLWIMSWSAPVSRFWTKCDWGPSFCWDSPNYW